MIISTTNLNNIENKITNPQVEGIVFVPSASTSYNAVKNYLINGKLPVFDFGNGIYRFIDHLEEDSENFIYKVYFSPHPVHIIQESGEYLSAANPDHFLSIEGHGGF